MMADEPKPLHVVSILERDVTGKLGWRGLLTTQDEAKAKALHESLIADDGVKARIEVIERKRRR